MDATTVTIVGAGPAGLTLGLALARLSIPCVILEKTVEIEEDPRGVYLTADAVRILCDLGLNNDIKKIGDPVPHVNFHQRSFSVPPFYQLETLSDAAQQAVPNGILQVQPYLERSLRDAINATSLCELRCGCEVVNRDLDGQNIVVTYKDGAGLFQKITSSWLVGADGKRGVVRKQFLEATAHIRQQEAAYKYEGTWVAANLHLTLPTPESHPEFPLWEHGYNPEQVYDLFWPTGWHFVQPPGKATATGRFGPHEARLWRHEFEQADWNDTMDAEAMLWDHLTPMITRSEDLDGRPLPCRDVEFPRDCISILRCRCFTFAHKIVNKWFDRRTILIGDAAHVFPPFGGQGIASGVRDAHQLAWRLALLSSIPAVVDDTVIDRLLSVWAIERTSSVKHAALLTRMNGELCNGEESFVFRLYRLTQSLWRSIPFLPSLPHPITVSESIGFSRIQKGFFDTLFHGGTRVAQVWVTATDSVNAPRLSDTLLHHEHSILTVLAIAKPDEVSSLIDEAGKVIAAVRLPNRLISEQSIVTISCSLVHDLSTRSAHYKTIGTTYQICRKEDIDPAVLVPGHDPSTYLQRLGSQAKYVIVRPDFYIYGILRDAGELEHCLKRLKQKWFEFV